MRDSWVFSSLGIGAAAGIGWDRLHVWIDSRKKQVAECGRHDWYYASVHDQYKLWTRHCTKCPYQEPWKELPPPGSIIRTRKGEHQVPFD